MTVSLGLVPTMVAGAVISGCAFLWVVLGPIFRLKKQPEPATD